jgi:hypothetical protein
LPQFTADYEVIVVNDGTAAALAQRRCWLLVLECLAGKLPTPKKQSWK